MKKAEGGIFIGEYHREGVEQSLGLLLLFLTALGLSMDAFAVSVTNGLCLKGSRGRHGLYTAGAFGLFQGMMPGLGFLLGQGFSQPAKQLDHWMALLLLGGIGGKMVKEGIAELRNPQVSHPRVFRWGTLLLQAVATSIDALAVGIGFAMLEVEILPAALAIGAVTFWCCLAGFFIGRQFGGLLKERAEIFGGVILILTGIKIWLEHTVG